MIKVVSFKICPFVQRVTGALEAKEIPYEIEYISLSEPPAWFHDVSPNGQVPLLITESGDTLFESDAIIEYLDDVHAPLQSDINAEQRAHDRAWSYQASKHYLVQCSAMQSASKEILSDRTDNLAKAFARAESVLEAGPFFRGDSIGNVDIAWLPLLHRASIIERRTGYDFLAGYPKAKLWQAELMKTGLAEKSVSPDFEDAFAAFYLSDRTYLGSGQDCRATAHDVCGSNKGCCAGC